MKKLFFWMLIVFFSAAVSAQQDYEKMAKKEAKHYIKVLDLNADQKGQIVDILKHKYESIDALMELQSSDEKAFRAKRRAVYAGTDGSIRLILNREQIDLYDVEKRRQRLINAEEIKRLKAAGADQDDILDAQYGIKN